MLLNKIHENRNISEPPVNENRGSWIISVAISCQRSDKNVFS